MASHLTVVDTSARRAKIAVTRNTYLGEVLDQAWEKLGPKSEPIGNYGLKNNNKTVDLSRNVGQSGLASGARLDLVLISKSPTPVSVALALPESLSKDTPNGRLQDKFSSSTTLWMILRAFESRDSMKFNFTDRGAPKTDSGDAGAGRIYYEMPVLNIAGRPLSTFADLQKNLAQLGFRNGSCMIRMSFKVTDMPLEEAKAQIAQYFSTAGEDEGIAAVATKPEKKKDNKNDAASAPEPSLATAPQAQQDTVSEELGKIEKEDTPMPDAPAPQNGAPDPSPTPATTTPAPTSPPSPTSPVIGPGARSISVYSAPTSSVPAAALQPHNDSDYELSIAQAQVYQSRLKTSSINKKMLSDAELDAAAQEAAAKAAAVREVKIRIRLPDGKSVDGTFGQSDTGETLYDFVRGLIRHEQAAFVLKYAGKTGNVTVPAQGGKKLIGDLGFRGGMLVIFHWGDEVTAETRSGEVLKEHFAQQARELKVPVPTAVESNDTEQVDKGKGKEKESKGESSGGTGVKNLANVKWLKFGKK